MNIALLGYGKWGRNWARVASDYGVLHTIVDIDPVATSQAALDYPNIETYQMDPFEYLRSFPARNVDAVIIATPAATHAPFAYLALETGLNVLVEKPAARCRHEAKVLYDQARLLNKVLMVDYTFLHSQPVQRFIQVLRQLAPVHHLELTWTGCGPIREDCDVIDNLAPHPLSILAALTGELPTHIQSAARRWHHCDWEDGIHWDWCNAVLVWDNLSARVEVSWDHPEKQRHLVGVAEEGHVICDPTRGELQVFDTEGVLQHQDLAAGPEPLATLLEEFVYRCVSGTLCTGRTSILVHYMMDLMRKSASMIKSTHAHSLS